jgi:molecular chaperone GrpE (heat shock protein)
MNDDFTTDAPDSVEPPGRAALLSLGSSTLLSLLEAMIQLSERNQREHKLFGQDLKGTRDAIQGSFRNFVEETQKAYQQLRKEVHGEKRVSLALLNELLEMGHDMEHIVSARPRIKEGMTAEEVQAVARWADAVEVQSRKVQAALTRHGIHSYDAVVGTPYDPKLHERIGSKRVEGMGPLLVAEQQQHGYASQQPEFVLRRPQVYVTE